MNYVILCCVILHNMAKNYMRPLVPLCEGETRGRIRAFEDVQFCLNRYTQDPYNAAPGTIASLTATHIYIYLNSAVEYMNTRNLIV